MIEKEEIKTIESKIFTWKRWDSAGDQFSMYFYECTLIKDFGPYKAGETFDLILIDYRNSLMEFWKEETEVVQAGEVFEIELIITKKVEQ